MNLFERVFRGQCYLDKIEVKERLIEEGIYDPERVIQSWQKRSYVSTVQYNDGVGPRLVLFRFQSLPRMI